MVRLETAECGKVKCMVDHVKPITWDKPDHIIFHVGTNDIPSEKDAGDICKTNS